MTAVVLTTLPIGKMLQLAALSKKNDGPREDKQVGRTRARRGRMMLWSAGAALLLGHVPTLAQAPSAEADPANWPAVRPAAPGNAAMYVLSA